MRVAIAALLLSAASRRSAASARSLEQVKSFGTLSVCLPANSLPFSSRHDDPAGFQVEFARRARQATRRPMRANMGDLADPGAARRAATCCST